MDFLGFYDNIKGSDLTILPDRRIAVSTQDNKGLSFILHAIPIKTTTGTYQL